jgi:hypothetical protein
MGDMPWASWEHTRQLQVYVTQYRKEDCEAQIHGNANDRKVMNQIDKWAKKDHTQNRMTFLNSKQEDDDQATLVVRPEAAPFPDIPAEAPGILTEHEEIHGANPIQDEPTQSDEEQAALAAENSGMEFGPINVRETREVIELLDDDDEDIFNNFIQDDVANKIEQQNNEDLRKVVEEEDEDEENEPISDKPRKSSRYRVPNRKFKDYELYVTVAEEDEFLLATNGEEFEEKEIESATISDEGMSAVAHYRLGVARPFLMLKALFLTLP